MLQDPVAGMELLAPYVFATHIKDVVVDTTFSAAHHCFFSSVPVGWGIVDAAKLAEILSRHNYEGMLAVEIDQLARQWAGLEDEAVAISVHELRKLAKKFS
jgi:sugar phosphate isomerase/epimerase